MILCMTNSIIASWIYRVKSVRFRNFSGPYFPEFGLNNPYLSLFSPNSGKYGPEKLQIRGHFHAVIVSH